MTTKSNNLFYKRVLIKISGEAFQSDQSNKSENGNSLDDDAIKHIVSEIKKIYALGVEIAVVVGGGNLIRGGNLIAKGFNRVTADKMGMMATVINGLALRDMLLASEGIEARIYAPSPLFGFADAYEVSRAQRCLKKGRVAIFVGGTGNPLVTTDSAAALRSVEINADILLKATKVDGVYASDPIKNPKAEFFNKITYDQIFEQRLAVMDYNSILLCRDNCLPICVFNMRNKNSFKSIILGEELGTLVSHT